MRIVPRADRRHVGSLAPNASSSFFLTPLAFLFAGERRCTAPMSIMTLRLKTAGRAASGRDIAHAVANRDNCSNRGACYSSNKCSRKAFKNLEIFFVLVCLSFCISFSGHHPRRSHPALFFLFVSFGLLPSRATF